jgi:hypothetical protein
MELAVLILGLLLLLQSPRLRPYAWWAASGLAAALVVYYVYDAQQERRAQERMGPDRVALSETHVLERDFRAFEVSGTLNNLSGEYAVQRVELVLTALHCPTPDGDEGCEARATAHVALDLRVAPGRSEPFWTMAYFEDVRAIPSNGLRWSLEVKRVWAD